MSIQIHDGKILHRTELMDAQQAERFAKMVAANSRFTAAEVVESRQAKPSNEERYFVSYSPASEAARLRMLDEQRAEQERRAAAEEFTFTWDATLGVYRCKSHGSAKEYETGVSSCTCPQSLYRLQQVGVPCKHSIAILNALEDGLVGEEEAREMAQEPCEACNEPTSERVTVHAEDGPGSLVLCQPCQDEQTADAERAALPSRAVTREEQRRIDNELFDALFAENEEWRR